MIDAPIGTVIANRYEIVKPPLAGGMGVVFLCRDRREDRPVALKTFKPEYLSDRRVRDLFLQEGTIWTELGRHPHIVRCHQVVALPVGREVYLVLEWVAEAEGKDNASLRAWLTPGKPLPLEQAIRFALHLVRGMKHATSKRPNLVHHDLHPGNLLVGRDGYLRVTDFGLAGVLSGQAGSPEYASPEQCRGTPLDERSDIYTFGCILYETVTGRPPFRVPWQTSQERWERYSRCHNEEDPPAVRTLVPTVPEPVEALVHGCLRKRPEARPVRWRDVEAAVAGAYRALIGKEPPTEEVADAETRTDRVAVGWSYNALGVSYRSISKFDVAVTYSERVIRIGRTEKARDLEGVGLAGLGNAYLDSGESRRAIGFLEQALTIAREIGNRIEEGRVLNNLGNAYRNLGELRRAIGFYEQRLTIARERGDLVGEGVTLGNMGIAYQCLGELRRAIDCYERHLITARVIRDQIGEGNALGNLGLAYLDLGEPRRAIGFLKQHVTIAKEVGDLAGQGRALNNLGNAYRNLGELRRAIELYEQALVIAREVGNVMGVAQTSYCLAQVLSRHGERPQALRHAECAVQLFTQLGHAQFASEAQQLLAYLRGQRT